MTPVATQQPISPLVIRLAGPADQPSLRMLAELDSSDPLAGAALIAELGGRAVAAAALAAANAIADPFLPTSDVLALLRLRASQLRPRLAPRECAAKPRLKRISPARSLLPLLR